MSKNKKKQVVRGGWSYEKSNFRVFWALGSLLSPFADLE